MNLLVLGKNIRTKRHEKKLTLEKLAEMVGISTNFIGQIERGDATASIQTLIDIANALEVSMDYIFGENINFHYNPDDNLNKQITKLTSGMTDNQKQIMVEFAKAIKKITH